MRQLPVAVVGCGGIAQMMHLPFLRELDDCFELVALCDVDEATLNAVADFYHVRERYTRIDELPIHRIEAILILTSGDHTLDTLWALDRSLHVFAEKPLAYTLEETDQILNAQERSGRVVMVGMMKQFDPGYRRGVASLRSIKDLRLVDARVMHPDDGLYRMHHRVVKAGNTTIGEAVPESQPLGAAMYEDVGKQALSREPVDLLQQATGSNDELINAAYLFLITSSIHDAAVLRGALGPALDVVNAHAWAGGTSLAATLKYPNEVRCTYTWSLLPYLKHYTQDYSFYGSDGRVHIRFPSPYLKNASTIVEVESMEGVELHVDRIVASYDEAFRLELLHFYECVVNGASPLTDVVGFRSDLELLGAIARAMT
jgi:predicted dehydrogenase